MIFPRNSKEPDAIFHGRQDHEKVLSLAQVYGLLAQSGGAVDHDAEEPREIMILSWLTMMDFEPPRLIYRFLYRLS